MTKIIKLRRPNKQPDDVFNLENNHFYDGWWATFGTPDLRKVIEHFGIDTFRRSSCLDGLDQWLTEIGFGGKCCIEIGSAKGLTAIVLSRHFEKVISIDIVPDEDKKAIASYLGIRNIRFFDAADNSDKAKLIQSFDFDAAYCDGDHSHDAQFDFDLVSRCGRVLFHEYWPLQPPIWNLVNRLRTHGNVETHNTMALWTKG